VPRELKDVLGYFLPEADAGTDGRTDRDRPRAGLGNGGPAESERPAELPIVALPIGDQDVVRAAFAWNLAVEVARRGAASILVAPAQGNPSLLWPDAGPGPVGSEMVMVGATDLATLTSAARDIALTRATDSTYDTGVVFVRIPPAWLVPCQEARSLLRWCLLFGTAEHRDLMETYALTKTLLEANPEARVGLTIHGVRRIAQAETAFRRVAEVVQRRLRRPLLSYGLLVDDLHIYRAIVARRPIGLEHPQSRAARALQDVARMIVEDARKYSLA